MVIKENKIPSGWKVTPLADILEAMESGKRPKGGVSLDSGEIPSLGGENILQEGGVRYIDVKKVSRVFFDTMKKGILSNGDVLINKDGANTGKVGLYDGRHFQNACINEHLFLLRAKANELTQEFMYYFMLSNKGQRMIKQCITGSAQPGLNTNFVQKFFISYPVDLLEQRKIADILTSVDHAIEKTEAIIQQTEVVKQGLMQKLLTKGIEHTKFKQTVIGEIPVGWELVKLSEVTTRITDGTHQSPEFIKQGIPFLLVSNIVSGKIDWDTEKYISEETYNTLTKNVKPERGDVLYSAVGSYGVAVLNETDQPFSFQRHIAHIKPIHEQLVPKFLVYVLNSPIGKKQADRVAVGNAQKTVTLGSLSQFVLPLPTLSEQEKISKLLSSIDDSIQKNIEYRNELLTIKIALSQVLLTGIVRVNVNESSEVPL